MRRFRTARICGLLLVCAVEAQAHTVQTPARNSAGCKTEELQAAHLGGTAVKFNIILPRDYTANDRRFPVLYLLHGYTGHYSDWCEKTHIVDYAKPYEEIIVMPEGENGWYVNNYVDPKMQWENYILEDLIPYVDAHYRTIASRQGRAIAGLSMGGYGAMFLGLKHHEMFAAVASLSGVVASANMARWDKPVTKNKQTIKENPGVRKTLSDDFGPAKNPARNGEDPFLLIRKLTPENCPQLYLAIGWGDSLLGENREFVTLLAQLKMPYRYAEVPGKHEWPVWDEEIRRVLALQAPVIGAHPQQN
ncbi:MAG TPA: alpha/beta hydrolase family protein [Candidatus Acidoferrales bacterium]|nr:alpha/beta hydrolase family protein [Candidatus Acidoferrales bacterium]